ncbi:MAG: VOC family protein [Pseudomonadota bacterium]
MQVFRYLGAIFLPLCLVSCSTVPLGLPSINNGEFRERLPGNFVWHDLISDDTEGSIRFYSRLFGWEFTEFSPLRYRYWTINHRGRLIGGMVAQSSLPATRDVSQWVSLLSVDDPQVARQRVLEAGGEVLRQPVTLGERGTIAVFADPQGAIFATVTSPNGDPELSSFEGDFFWHELWAASVEEAADFYSSLSDRVSVEDVEFASSAKSSVDFQLNVDFQLLVRAGFALAGIRSRPADDLPTIWMPFLRVESEQRLAELLERVPELGGEVLVPTVARPATGFLAVIAGPSGAPVALQTWSD